MQAALIRKFGNLKVEEIPTPRPGDGEVLVAIRAAAINASDVKNMQGTMHGTTLPRIPGRDFAGVVVEGPEQLKGREVWGTGGDIGFTRDGSHAEFMVLPVEAAIPKPPPLSMEAAGSAGLTFVTAWSAIVQAARLESGQTALIIGAAGAVGMAAVQIAKSRGARVIGVVRSENDFATVREGGAHEVLNSEAATMEESFRALTNGRGADVVFDTTGAKFADAVEAAAQQGRVAVISAPADGKSTFNLRSLYRKELRVVGVDTRRLNVVASARLLTDMAQGFWNGDFKSKAAESVPLNQAAEAYARAARGGARILLRPGA